MPFEDFTNKEWKVIQNEDDSLCKKDAKVTFLVKLRDKPDDGEPKQVKISCSNELAYEGTYDENSDTIKGNGYEIRRVRCIKFMPTTEGSRAGSWTAEDQGPWPGDDE